MNDLRLCDFVFLLVVTGKKARGIVKCGIFAVCCGGVGAKKITNREKKENVSVMKKSWQVDFQSNPHCPRGETVSRIPPTARPDCCP